MLPIFQFCTLVDRSECEGGGVVDQEVSVRTLAQVMARLRRATTGTNRARPFESVTCFGQVAATCNEQRIADFWQSLDLDER